MIEIFMQLDTFGKFIQPHTYLIIETASFKLGYSWNHLVIWKSFIQICIYYKYFGKLPQPKSYLGQLKRFHSNLGRVKSILN